MKNLNITLLFMGVLLFSQTAYSQMIGLPYADVIRKVKESNLYSSVVDTVNDNGVKVLAFKMEFIIQGFYFFDSKGICNASSIAYPNKYILYEINYLDKNKNYVKVDKYHWIDTDNKIYIALKPIEGEAYFVESHTRDRNQ